MPALTAKVALIHGAGREPARSIAHALATEGASLALADLTPMAMEAEAVALAAQGAPVSTHVADPSKGLSARMLLDEVLERWGQVDVLVLHPRAEPRQSLLELDEWDWQRTLESNLNAPFLLMQLAGTWLAQRERPGVFLILTIGPSVPPTNPAGFAFYTSQMALRALAQSAAAEFAALGIRLYALALREESPAALAQAARLAVRLCRDERAAPAGTLFEFPEPEAGAP
jgi:3-oxoacyl-[acyl-carrier protein] reductase